MLHSSYNAFEMNLMNVCMRASNQKHLPNLWSWSLFQQKNGEAIETPEFLTIPPTGDVDQVKVVTPVATAVPRVVACTGGSQACYILWVNQFNHV